MVVEHLFIVLEIIQSWNFTQDFQKPGCKNQVSETRNSENEFKFSLVTGKRHVQ